MIDTHRGTLDSGNEGGDCNHNLEIGHGIISKWGQVACIRRTVGLVAMLGVLAGPLQGCTKKDNQELVSDPMADKAGDEDEFDRIKREEAEELARDRLEDIMEKRELTPEQSEATIKKLEARFQKNQYLHEGINFQDVKNSLKANPKMLWRIAQMEEKGHEPNVYNSDETGFDIGTCSREVPTSTRNCVYNKTIADFFQQNPKFSAVEMAKGMGTKLMGANLYRILQKKGGDKFDLTTQSWLLTPPTHLIENFELHPSINPYTRCDGLLGSGKDGITQVNRNYLGHQNRSRGFRVSIRVNWTH